MVLYQNYIDLIRTY